MTLDLEARRRIERRKTFYAFGVVTLLCALIGWHYQEQVYRFHMAQPIRAPFVWQMLKLDAFFYDVALHMRGLASDAIADAIASSTQGSVRSHVLPLVMDEAFEKKLRAELQKFAGGIYRHLLDIVVVAIDDQTVDSLHRAGITYPPMPRAIYGELVRCLHRAGAKAIAFDIYMDMPSPLGKGDDDEFTSALKETKKGLLACRLFVERASGGVVIRYKGPHTPLDEQAAGLGLIEMTEDPRDDFIRMATVAVPYQGEWLPSLATVAAARWLGLSDRQLQKQLAHGQFNGHALPLVKHRVGEVKGKSRGFEGLEYEALLLNFAGPEKTFRHVSLEVVLFPKENNLTDEDLRRLFNGKLVFVGSTSEVDKDIFPTPTSTSFPGVEIHATLAQMLLSGKFLRLAPLNMARWVLLLFVGLTAALVFWLRPLRAIVPVFFLGVACLYATVFVLDRWLLVMPVVQTLIAMMLSFVLSTAYLQFAVERHAYHIRQRFGRFVAPSVLETMVFASEEELTHPRRVEATAMFTDLKGFTTISEERSPEEVAAILNEYFEVMTGIIDRHQGTVSKFSGDGIMALFGLPMPYPDHAARAVRCAVEMQQAIDELRQRFLERGLPELFMRIGIHTGEMVFGAIGAQRQSDLTAIGDTVNVAARLEPMNKEFGSRILISETTYEQAIAAGANLTVEAVGEVTVRGRARPIRVFKVLGADGQMLPEATTTVQSQTP